MTVRPYTAADLDALKAMHAAQGFDYAFPDLDDSIFLSKLVVEDDQGRPVMASLLRLTAEAYLLLDPRAGRPRERWWRFLALHEAARRDAFALGLDDAQAFVPPKVERSFGRRLAKLGWVKDPWPAYCRRVEG